MQKDSRFTYKVYRTVKVSCTVSEDVTSVPTVNSLVVSVVVSRGAAKRSGTWTLTTGNRDSGAVTNFFTPPKRAVEGPPDWGRIIAVSGGTATVSDLPVRFLATTFRTLQPSGKPVSPDTTSWVPFDRETTAVYLRVTYWVLEVERVPPDTLT